MSARSTPRRARRSVAATRQRQIITKHSLASGYTRIRAGVVLALFLLTFGFLWLVNGTFTASYVVTFGASPEIGWSLHLLLTAIEIAPAVLKPYAAGIPRRVLAVLWLISLPFGVFDVLSSAIGVAPFVASAGAGAGAAMNVISTLAGIMIAFMPEPMMLYLLVGLRNVIRD